LKPRPLLNKRSKIFSTSTKALQRLNKGDAPADVLTSLANQLTNKIIHTPSIQLKQASAEGREDMLTAVEDLFQLGDDDQSLDN